MKPRRIYQTHLRMRQVTVVAGEVEHRVIGSRFIAVGVRDHRPRIVGDDQLGDSAIEMQRSYRRHVRPAVALGDVEIDQQRGDRFAAHRGAAVGVQGERARRGRDSSLPPAQDRWPRPSRLPVRLVGCRQPQQRTKSFFGRR